MMGILSKLKAIFKKPEPAITLARELPSSELPTVRRMNEIIAGAREARATRLREVARSRR